MSKQMVHQEELRQKYRQVSEVFVQREQSNEEVIGIIVSGSAIHSRIDKNSDIDIQVILHPDCQYRERGNTWINGIEIEYFKNPPQQIRSYFKKEYQSPHTAHMLNYGEVMYQNSSVIADLCSEAAKIINQLPPSLPKFAIELAKYGLDDLYKDLEDAQLNKDELAIGLIRAAIINKCIDIFCAVHRIRRLKNKKLKEQLGQVNLEFADLIEQTLTASGPANPLFHQLRITTETFLGGRRTTEWILKSPLDL